MGVYSEALYSCLLSDLGNLVDEHLPSYPPDATYKQVAAYQIRSSLLKKYSGAVQAEADERAWCKFQEVNSLCSSWEPRWGTYEDEFFGEIKHLIREFWAGKNYLSPLISTVNDLYDHAVPGPGSSRGSYGSDFYTKHFSGPLTCTDQKLYHWYEACLRSSPSWSDAEKIRKDRFGEARCVEGNRFHFVPKNERISRLICIEPSVNMFFQLGFKAKLEQRLRRYFGIDFSYQQFVSRELAQKGSSDNSLVTIDLSSASDSLSLKMIEYFLPPDFVWWLKSLRSPFGERSGEQVELHMISTMGNGYTFPLQTMLFSCVIAAVARVRGIELTRSYPVIRGCPERGFHLGNWSVYGDDIICPREIAGDVIRILGHLGFQVNGDKTFVEGPFRESCGADFFRGQPVRGVYISDLGTQQDLVTAINRLNAWSAVTGIYLPTTVQYLLRGVEYKPVPYAENEDAGVKVPFSMVRKFRRDRNTSSIKYRRFVSKPRELHITGEGTIILPRGERRKRIYNPNGLLVALLHGSLVSGRITIRHDVVTYRTKWGLTPYWDWVPPVTRIARVSWQQWNTAVYYNLML